MDILSILLTVVLLLLFPLGQTLRIDLGSGIAINPLDIGVGITAMVTIILFVINKKRFPSIFIPLGGFLFFGLFGLAFHAVKLLPNELSVALLYFIRFVLYAILGLTVWTLSKKRKAFLYNILLFSGGVFLVAGVIQYFFFPSLWGLIYAGWDPHLYRLFSTFLDPNFAGVLLGIYFLLVIHSYMQQKTIQKRFAFGALGFFTLLTIVLTYSRTTYVATFVGLLVYLSFIKLRYIIYILIGLGIIILFILSPLVHKYGEGVNLFRTVSTVARLTDDVNALTIWSKSPLVGVGFDAYRYSQHEYHIINGFNWKDTHSGAGVSNSLLFVLATTGILGSVCFGYFWLALLRRSYTTRKINPYSIMLFSSFVLLLVSSLFENTLFYPSIMLWMWVLVGFID